MLWRQATTAFFMAFKNKAVVEVEICQPLRHCQPLMSYKNGIVRITFPDQNPLLETETPPKPCDGTLQRCVFPEYPPGKRSGR